MVVVAMHILLVLELEIIWNLAPITQVQWRYLDESSYDWYKGTVLTHFQCMDSDGNPSPKAGTIYDSHSNLKQCASISLQLNEYIDSYRIQSSERVNGEQIEYIYGIHFKTSLDNTFSCGGSPPFRTLDSGWIAYKGYHMEMRPSGVRLASILQSEDKNVPRSTVRHDSEEEGEAPTRVESIQAEDHEQIENEMEGVEIADKTGIKPNIPCMLNDDEFIVVGDDETAGQICRK
eukprot:533704_1